VLPVNFAYYLVYPEDTADRPKIANFRHWILAEIDAGKSR
jgi:DNA-binding transcriptional LysR family regulator